MRKTFMNIEVANIVAYFNQATEALKVLPLKTRWALKKNLETLIPAAQNIDKFRNDVTEELREQYFSDEKSDVVMVPETDAEGNPVLDENGEEVLQEGRRVKEEFMAEFNEKVNALNKEIQELWVESAEYEISCIDLDAFVESLPDDTDISFELVEMLSFMDKKTEGDE